jgi:hypothetical protein
LTFNGLHDVVSKKIVLLYNLEKTTATIIVIILIIQFILIYVQTLQH